MNRVIAIAAAVLLAASIATPAVAAPPPSGPGGSTPAPGYYTNAVVALPNCKAMGRAAALRNSASTFTLLGDLSNPLTGAGYGTTMAGAKTIIEDGGFSCTWQLAPKQTLTISIAPISAYDRARIQSLYLTTFGTTGTSIGGSNLMFHGYSGSTLEVGMLLEEGVYLTGRVTDVGDYFPAVLQDIADMVYYLND